MSTTNSLVKLQPGSPVTATLSTPTEKHTYYFDVKANQPVILSLTSLANAYQWYHYEVEYPLPKPGPVEAHSIAKGLSFTTTTETFAPSEDTRVYLSIGSSNESVLPAAGYTVEISS